MWSNGIYIYIYTLLVYNNKMNGYDNTYVYVYTYTCALCTRKTKQMVNAQCGSAKIVKIHLCMVTYGGHALVFIGRHFNWRILQHANEINILQKKTKKKKKQKHKTYRIH